MTSDSPATTPEGNPTINLDLAVAELIPDEKAVTLAPPVSVEAEKKLRKEAAAYITQLSKLDHNSPEFVAKIEEISNKANTDIATTTDLASTILDTTLTSVSGSKRHGNAAQKEVSTSLADLRNTVQEYSPDDNLSGVRKILGIIPAGRNIDRYLRRFDTAKTQLDAITTSLFHGRDELIRDNAALKGQEERLWSTMGKLNEASFYLQALDDATVQKISDLRDAGKAEEADVMDKDILFPIRQRSQDVVTQMGVSAQSYLAMGLIRKNNQELVKGIERAQSTTVVALQTAVTIATALSKQEDQINSLEAVNKATNIMLVKNSENLKNNAVRTNALASKSGVSVEAIRESFNNVFATMDAIDNFKSEANAQMDVTRAALVEQLERTKPYLERSRKEAIGSKGSQGQLGS